MLPLQVVLGIPDAAGAMFMFDDAIRVIGEAGDRDRVLDVARACNGERQLDEVLAVAADAAKILDALLATGIVVDGATTEVETDKRTELATANRLVAMFVGADRLITTLDVYRPCFTDDTLLPYFAASGEFRYPDGKPYVSFGTAATPAGAVIRAIAEAFERVQHGSEIRIDAFGPAEVVGPTCVFDAVTYQASSFRRDRGLAAYEATSSHPWVRAQKLGSTESTFVLADTVYYPVTSAQLGRPKVSEPLTSGTAAHFDRDRAIQSAMLELIERDALAVTWAAKRAVTALPRELASQEIRDRLVEWTAREREFVFLDLTLDSVPVVLVLSRGPQYPHISAGCAAATTYEAAIEKAYSECETIALTWATSVEPKPEPNAWLSAKGHGLLYAHPGNEHRLDWLFASPVAKPTAPRVEWNELVRRFAPLVIDLHVAASAEDLWVVKVLSNELLPLTFGDRSEPHGHPRLEKLGFAWRDAGYPHFFA